MPTSEKGKWYVWLKWRPGAYLRQSGSLLWWLVIRALAQAGLVVLLSRSLGVAGYGRFVTALALATFFTPLAGLGLHGVLLRDGSRTPERLAGLLGQALSLWALSTLVFGFVAVVVACGVMPTSPGIAVVALICSEVANTSLVEMLARCDQSRRNIGQYGASMAGLILFRLVALAAYALWVPATIEGWMWVYATASVVYVLVLVLRAYRVFQPETGQAGKWWMVKEGAPFAIAATSMRVQAEFNKPVLARLDYGMAGNFSAAQRATDIVSLPLMAMQDALWPRLFADKRPRRRMLVTGAFLVVLALCAGVFMTLVAPLIPVILGHGFKPAIEVLRIIAWLPALQVVRNFANFAVMAQYKTHLLTHAYIIGTATSIVATSLLATNFGMRGAALAMYITEAVIIATLIVLSRLKPPEQQHG